jgi:REP element-mobilizing transposase RayT
MQIFLDDVDYREFGYLLGDVVEECEVECWNYCLMPNHYHVTLKPTRPNLSQVIRRLNSTYGQWWNRRHRRVGHVFQGRFKDQIVEHSFYLVTLSRYIVLNPVRAGLVERPEEWSWSSYRASAGLCPRPSFLAGLATQDAFGDDEGSCQARFVHLVSSGSDDDTLVDRIRSNDRILGTSAFKTWVKASRDHSNTSAQALETGLEVGSSMT